MASPAAHVAVALTLGNVLHTPASNRQFWLAAAACSLIPDLDVLSPGLFGGHRGLSHSLFFAPLVGTFVLWLGFRGPESAGSRLRYWLCFTLATASHGLLDSLTDYGSGIAFLAPFSGERYTAPWHPLGTGARGCQGALDCFATAAGNEVLWVGVPCLVFATLISLWRARSR